MTKPLWTDSRIREGVSARRKHYRQQGANLLDATLNAYPDVCQEMRDEYERRIAELEADSDAVDADLDEGAMLMDGAADMIDALRLRVQELEAYAVRAQDTFRRALLLELPSAELRELRDSAPIAKPEPEPPAHSGVRVYNYAKEASE